MRLGGWDIGRLLALEEFFLWHAFRAFSVLPALRESLICFHLLSKELLKSLGTILCRWNRNIIDVKLTLRVSHPAIRLASLVRTLAMNIALETRTRLLAIVVVEVVVLLLAVLIVLHATCVIVIINLFIDAIEAIRVSTPVVARLGALGHFANLHFIFFLDIICCRTRPHNIDFFSIDSIFLSMVMTANLIMPQIIVIIQRSLFTSFIAPLIVVVVLVGAV